MKEDVELITIRKDRYKDLLKSEELLSALQAHGIDNWEGYRLALLGLEPKESKI